MRAENKAQAVRNNLLTRTILLCFRRAAVKIERSSNYFPAFLLNSEIGNLHIGEIVAQTGAARVDI
jgi:hypothetical protein